MISAEQQRVLNSMSEAALRELNSAVIDAIRAKMRQEELRAAKAFVRGDIARFFARSGRLVHIRIDQFNTKTVSGTVCDEKGALIGGKYRVPPSMLTRVSI